MTRARLVTRLSRIEARFAQRMPAVPTRRVADEIEEMKRDFIRIFKEQGPAGIYKYLEDRGIEHPETCISLPGARAQYAVAGAPI